MFGYKNHVIDRAHGFPRRDTVTYAAAHDGGQLDRSNIASDVWADTAYRSAANLALLDRRGLKPQFSEKTEKPVYDRSAHRADCPHHKAQRHFPCSTRERTLVH